MSEAGTRQAADATLRRARALIAEGHVADAIGVLIMNLAGPQPDLHAARLLASLLGSYRVNIQLALEAALRAACAFPALDLQTLVRSAIGCLLARPEWQPVAGADDVTAAVARALGTGGLAPFDDPLLLAILCRGVCNDARFERLLRALRRAFLRTADGDLPPDWARLAASLARQAANNEYVWPVDEDERSAVDDLTRRLDAGILLAESDLLRIAMYRLPTSWGAAARRGESARGGELGKLHDAIQPGAEEVAARATMPSLAPIGDAVSKQVRAQYEENPFPRWLALNPPAEGSRRQRLAAHCAPADRQRFAGPVHVLIAGCGTGRQAIAAYLGYGGECRLLAIDLSAASLAYGRHMAGRYGADAVEFLQADILDLARLDRTFDAIEAVGVLHHMEDPLAGWRALAGRLRPGGLMNVALYSERGRADVAAARRSIAALGLLPTAEGIRQLRRLVLDAPEDAADWRVAVRRLADFYTASGCRDLLFHVREHRFTPLDLRDALAAAGLEFRGLEVAAPTFAAYRQRYPGDPHGLDLCRWDAFEAEHPRIFSSMIRLWCRRPD